eukprot:8378453-Prorocentrum_lima.AAC.1
MSWFGFEELVSGWLDSCVLEGRLRGPEGQAGRGCSPVQANDESGETGIRIQEWTTSRTS